MLTRQFDIVARGKFLHQFDIRNQGRTGIDPFQQVMAEDGVFRDPLFKGALEEIDIIDALADEGAFLEQVLIDIGHGEGIGIEAVGTGEGPLEERTFRPHRQ